MLLLLLVTVVVDENEGLAEILGRPDVGSAGVSVVYHAGRTNERIHARYGREDRPPTQCTTQHNTKVRQTNGRLGPNKQQKQFNGCA